MLPFIDLKKQYQLIKQDVDKAVLDVLGHGKYIFGPEVSELECALAEFAGVKHAVGCSSGTDALLLALMALGVKAGDAVFTSPFTFFATAEVISLLGATPVFVDIKSDTYNIDPGQLERTIAATKAEGKLACKAIIAVDIFGLCADYDKIQNIADKHQLALVEDAAQSFGAEMNCKRTGSFGDIAATSFFPAKPLGCYGDGGAVFTDNDALAEKVRSLLNHGAGSDKYNNVAIGINGRLDSIQAAVLLKKLAIFGEEVESRQRVDADYRRCLSGCEHVTKLPCVPAAYKSVFAQYCIEVDDRELVMAALKEHEIPSAVYYPVPLHLQTAFAYLRYKAGDFPVSEAVAANIMALPMHPYLDTADIERIAGVIKNI